MSDDLRDILGIGSKKMPLMSVPLAKSLTAAANEGANKGFWRIQLRDQSGNWVQMGGAVTFEVDLPDLGKVFGTGTYQGASKENPNEIIIRVKDHPKLPDGDYSIPPDNLEESAEAIIPAEALARLVKKDEGVSIEQMEAEAAQAEQVAPALKDEITGDEALKIIRSAVAKDLKAKGRFPLIRTEKDIEDTVSKQYMSLFEQIKKENPEVLKGIFNYQDKDGQWHMNVDIETQEQYWEHLRQYSTDLTTQWIDPEKLSNFIKVSNTLYAQKFLGIKPDGLITFYRNNIRRKNNEVEAAAGYASLDKYMAFDYNVARGLEDGGAYVGRYEVKARPDEVTGLLGFSRIGDEIGVVISPRVTEIPGRFKRVGNLEIPNPDNAPWFDLENLKSGEYKFDRSTGGSPFRHLKPLGQFDYYALDSSPFGEGRDWASFYEANGLKQGDLPSKYDELYGAGSWEKNWGTEKPRADRYKAFFKEFKDKDGKTRWGLEAQWLDELAGGSEKYSNDPRAGDEFDRAIKVLSTMQELIGKPFFVSRGHDQNDPRLAEVIKEVVEPESRGQKVIDFSTFEKVSEKLGSNPGGVYKDPKTGKQYYVKIQDKDRGNNEALGSALYQEAGLDILKVDHGTLNGESVTYTEWREGLTPISKSIGSIDPDSPVMDGFAVDAWLSNWDVVGTGYDNLSFDKDGNPVRLDSGGSLLYRARGARKGDAFGNKVGELDTFRDTSNTTGELYKDISPSAIQRSVEKLEAITPERIDELVNKYISNPADNAELKEKLKARRQFILDKYADLTPKKESKEPLTDSQVNIQSLRKKYLTTDNAQAFHLGDTVLIKNEDGITTEIKISDENTAEGIVSLRIYDIQHDPLKQFPNLRDEAKDFATKWYQDNKNKFIYINSKAIIKQAEKDAKDLGLDSVMQDIYVDATYNSLSEHVDSQNRKLHVQMFRDMASAGITDPPEVSSVLKRDEAIKQISSLMSDPRVALAIDTADLLRVLDDGKFKSQFETTKSKGTYNPILRAKMEMAQLGVPLDEKDELRPIYGYVTFPTNDDLSKYIDPNTFSPINTSSVARYGELRVVFKPSVKDKTTFTSDDSLMSGYDSGQPLSGLITPEKLEDAGLINGATESKLFIDTNYFEAQIHNGVSSNDIEKIIVPLATRDRGIGDLKDNKESQLEKANEIKQKLKELGLDIPIEIEGETAPESSSAPGSSEGEVTWFDDGESKGSKLIDTAIESGDIDYKLLPESTIESNFDRKDIPTEQDQALFAYSMSTFLDINAYLRNDEVSILSTKQYLDGHIANLDKLIDEKGDVLEEAVVYRGTSAEKDSPNHILLESIQEGDIVEDLAYSSTTKSPKVAFEAFGPSNQKYEGVQTKTNTPSNRGGNSSFWMVTLPVGSKALAKPAGEYGHSHEKEVLLPRGSKFRINAIRKVEQVGQNGKKNGNFNYFIDATVVPDSAVETKESEQSGIEVPGGDVEFFDDSEKPKGPGLTVNGRSELREIKRRLGGEIFDTTAIKLIEKYSGSDGDVKKLDAALNKEGLYRKGRLFSDGYIDAVRSAIFDYKKIDPNLNTERKAKRAQYGMLNGTGLGVIGYLQAGTLTKFDNFDFSYVSDKDKLSAAREEIIKNGFVNPITILYNPGRDEFSLENPEDSLKILATREIKDPDIKIRAIPTVVKVSAESDSFDKDTELNPVFFYELSQPSAWVADIQVKPEEYYDLSGIDSLPVPSRTDTEKEAIDFYQRGTYLTLKKYLADPSSAGDDAEKLGKIVDTLNKLGNSEKLPANTELFRGFRLSADSDLYKYYSSLKSGDVLADPNRFGSTSLDPIVAEDFATLGGKKDDYTGSVILEISTEEGATGVVFGDNKDTYASGVEVVLASEKEVLLPFGAELKIDKLFKDSDGILRIRAKYGKKVELESKSDAADQDFIDFSSFEKVSGRLGHTDGGKYKDPKTGKEYYVKIQDGKRGANEALASALYNEAGIDSIRVKNGVLDGTPITYTEWRDDLAPISERISNITSDDPALDGFAIDAWLANWDTVGAGDFGGYNNISYDKDGNPVRIDAGGALLYRGAGLRKGSTFGNEVGELETFKNTNFTTGELFSKITYETELASVDRLRKITPERIDELVDQYVSDSDDNKELKDKLKARREFILSKYEPTSEAEQSDESDPFDQVEWFDDIEQPAPTSKVLDSLLKDGIVNLDAAPDSTILSNFTKDEIPLEQKNALFYYLGPQYRSFNNFLRFGNEDGSDKVPDIEQRIKDLDALIESRGTVEAESFVYRGMVELPKFEDTDITMSEMLDGIKPGDVISDPAFLSTSSDKNIALRKFGPGVMTDNGPTLDASNPVYEPSSFWAIRVPKGSKALAAPEDSYFSEKEVLLPRNTQLRIDGIKKVAQVEEGGENGNFNYYIEASVIPVSNVSEPLDPPRIDVPEQHKWKVESNFGVDDYYNKVVKKIHSELGYYVSNLPFSKEYNMLEGQTFAKKNTKIKKVKGLVGENNCWQNVAEAIRQGWDGDVYLGFSADEGASRGSGHAWLVKDGEVLETTHLAREVYYGKKLSDEDKKRFLAEWPEENYKPSAETKNDSEKNLLDIPYRTNEWVPTGESPKKPGAVLKKSGFGGGIYESESSSRIIDIGDRKFTVADIDGIKVPFYLSTGQGGKKDVEPGKWYPVPGIGPDGWINKSSKGMVNYYGSEKLRKQAEWLDANIGDIREDKSVPKAAADGRHVDFINQDMGSPVSQTDGRDALDAHITNVFSKFESPKESEKSGETSKEGEVEWFDDSGLDPKAKAEKYKSDFKILSNFEADKELATSYDEILDIDRKRREWLEANGVTVKEIGSSKLITFTPEEIKNAYNYRPEGGIYSAVDMTDEQGREFNRRMQTLADLKKPGSISTETIEDQNRLNRKTDGSTAALIEVKELRHSAPASRFGEITDNGIRPKATNKVGGENYTRRRFGVFLANGYTSSEAGERADVFRVKVPESDLRVDAGYAKYGSNLYVERTIKPEELEHIGHYPVGGDESLHSGRGAECKDCDLAEKKRQEAEQKREEEKKERYSTPVAIYQLKYEDGKLADYHAVHYKSGENEMHTGHSVEECPETVKNPNVTLRPEGIGENETLAEIVAKAEKTSISEKSGNKSSDGEVTWFDDEDAVASVAPKSDSKMISRDRRRTVEPKEVVSFETYENKELVKLTYTGTRLSDIFSDEGIPFPDDMHLFELENSPDPDIKNGIYVIYSDDLDKDAINPSGLPTFDPDRNHFIGAKMPIKRSASEQKAIDKYTSSGYREINTDLIENNGIPSDVNKQIVKDLDSHLDNSILDEDTVLWRGLSVTDPGYKNVLESLVPGDTIVQPSYMSTSRDKASAGLFMELRTGSSGELSVLMKINAKKGTKASNMFRSSLGASAHEEEVLLPRGDKMTDSLVVTKVEKDKYDPTLLHMELDYAPSKKENSLVVPATEPVSEIIPKAARFSPEENLLKPYLNTDEKYIFKYGDSIEVPDVDNPGKTKSVVIDSEDAIRQYADKKYQWDGLDFENLRVPDVGLSSPESHEFADRWIEDHQSEYMVIDREKLAAKTYDDAMKKGLDQDKIGAYQKAIDEAALKNANYNNIMVQRQLIKALSEEYPDNELIQMTQKNIDLSNTTAQYLADKIKEEASVVIAIDPKNLINVLNDGRFKSQFEAGRSAGMYGPLKRSYMELGSFGIPLDEDPKKRPIYGYVSFPTKDRPDRSISNNGIPLKIDNDNADQYGKAKVVLKASARQKTTFTTRDSLNFSGVPQSMSDTTAENVNKAGLASKPSVIEENLIRSGAIYNTEYMEAQVHGGVSIDDIQEILLADRFDGDPEIQRQAEKLRELIAKLGLGISVKVV